jgi:hypothetical protein
VAVIPVNLESLVFPDDLNIPKNVESQQNDQVNGPDYRDHDRQHVSAKDES